MMTLRGLFVALLGVLLVFAVTARLAHSQAGPPTARVQALTQKLIGEINAGLACDTAKIALQDQVAKLQAELKAAKKVETKKPEPGKKP